MKEILIEAIGIIFLFFIFEIFLTIKKLSKND